MQQSADDSKLHSVNVRLTQPIIDAMTAIEANRSSLSRRVCSAVLHALDQGADAPYAQVLELAQHSSSRVQQMLAIEDIHWIKAIIWIPERMHQRMVDMLKEHNLRPADFIRGALMAFTEINPMPELSAEHRELWTAHLAEEKAK